MKVLLVAPVGDKTSGYGNVANGLLTVLKGMEHAGHVDSLTVFDTHPVTIQISIEKDEFDVALVLANPQSFLKPSRAVEYVLKIAGRARKSYLMVFWETEPLPVAWKKVWHMPDFDGYLAPSYFIGRQLAKVTDKPIFFCPPLVNVEEYDQVVPAAKSGEDVFTVLYVGQNTLRKGLTDSIIGYARSIAQFKDTQLIVKYHTLSKYELPPELLIKHVTLCNSTDKNIQIYTYTESLERKAMNEFMARGSVLLFPSRGEGFGLPCAEAMSMGIPIIYTPWSSVPEVCHPEGNYPLEYVVDEAHSMMQYGYDTGSRYAVPKIASIMACLDEAYRGWKEDKVGYYERAAENRRIIDTRFGCQAIEGWINRILGNKPSDLSVHPYTGERYE